MSAATPVIAVGGSLAQRPGAGGHAWVFAQYLLGFRRLGFDVVFVDHLPAHAGGDLGYVRTVMDSFGLGNDWCLLADHEGTCHGLPRDVLLERLRGAELLLNVMGFVDDEEVLTAVGQRVFLDIDPGFGQMWHALGQADVFAGHDRHVTIGERIGAPDCTIPTCDLDWITTKQPVVLSEWPAGSAHGGRFTSVGTWRGPFDPIEYDGRTYGLRVHEFRRFFDLPRRTGAAFEVALDIDPVEDTDLEHLRSGGWTLSDPLDVAADPWTYRRFVQRSKAEFMVAKNLYVASRSGWFSDRSACYLASGRPVLAQDTGLSALLPIGEGLLTYEDLDDAVRGVAAIDGDWERHARAARRIAEEHFDSDRVLRRLLAEVGVSAPRSGAVR